MGLYFLNISVDTADPYPNYLAEDLSINDQESIIEFFIEKVLGYGDVILEYDDVDTDEQQSSSQFSIKFLIYVVERSGIKPIVDTFVQLLFSKASAYLTIGFSQVFSPPPES